jgi:hypothetical protein
LRGPRIEGRAKVTTKRITEPARKSHPSEWLPETIHIPAAKNTRRNTIPKDRSEDSLISSSLSKSSCIFLLLEFEIKDVISPKLD